MVDRFDERLGPGTAYPSAEDNDYAYRLLKAGYQIVYCPKAIVYHQAWRTGEQYLPLRWNYGVGRGAVYAKHARLRDRFMLRQMLWDIRVHLQAIAGKIHRDRQQALGDFILALGIGWGALRWLVMETK
jgi:GT2 family glycosyltransferase